MGSFKAVLWDMDGTLVDTEPYWIDAEIDVVTSHGGTWTHEQGLQQVGNALDKTARSLQEAGVDLTIAEIVDALQTSVASQVGEDPRYRPGAVELLRSLRGTPMALVTMSWTLLADAVVQTLPDGIFEHVVTGDQVTAGKPDPECYLRACELLNLRPDEVIAIEDSVTGADAAGNAGIVTLGVEHLVELPSAPRRRVISSLRGFTKDDLAGVFDELS